MSLEVFGYIVSVVSALGIILNAKHIIWCWPVWLVSNAGWIAYSLLEKDYPSVVLWTLFTLFNIYGWRAWYVAKKKNVNN